MDVLGRVCEILEAGGSNTREQVLALEQELNTEDERQGLRLILDITDAIRQGSAAEIVLEESDDLLYKTRSVTFRYKELKRH